jgi:hypothetical protein
MPDPGQHGQYFRIWLAPGTYQAVTFVEGTGEDRRHGH